MTLGGWFRDYVYIPLGGNRRGILRQIINILTVWILTGLWHGAAWNFVLWGLYFALLLIAEKLFLRKKLEKHPILSHVYLLLAVFLLSSDSEAFPSPRSKRLFFFSQTRSCCFLPFSAQLRFPVLSIGKSPGKRL